MASHRFLINILIALPFSASAQIDSIITEHFSPVSELMLNAWTNPALMGEKYLTSLSSIGGAFHYSKDERYGEFKSETYLKLKNLTLTAHVNYHNGARFDVRFSENADISKIYPYLTYDAQGGNLNLERYSFGGNVSVKLSDRWTVGASASYDAGLYYRNVDPRPKTITGCFNIGTGASYRIGPNYRIGVNGSYEKYKQTCDITFISELGTSIIYHLTGLGQHYNRFAGQGLSSYYNGYELIGGITFYPLSSGIYANLSLSKDKIIKILEDLNNLPMAKIDQRSFSFQAGYKTERWGIVTSANFKRRHGYENIFGDTASGQYPLIYSLSMHLINSNEVSIRGFVKIPLSIFTLYIDPIISYNHYKEIYRDPGRILQIDNITGAFSARAIKTLSDKFLIYGSLSYKPTLPISHNLKNLNAVSDDLVPFIHILKDGYEMSSSYSQNFDISAGIDYMLPKGKYAIGIEASYQKEKLNGDRSTFSVMFKF